MNQRVREACIRRAGLPRTHRARVGPDGYADALRSGHAREMDFTGRPMKGYVFVAPEGLVDDAELAKWVRICAAIASMGSDR